MRLLRRKTKSFEIQVQDLVLRITADDDFAEESRAAALSFWEQLQSYALQHPEFRTSKRPLDPPAAEAPAIVQEMVASASAAGVGPMFTFRGAVVDQVGRFLLQSAERGHRRVRGGLLHHREEAGQARGEAPRRGADHRRARARCPGGGGLDDARPRPRAAAVPTGSP